MLNQPAVSSTPQGEAEYTAQRPPADGGAGGVHVEIVQAPEGFLVKCAHGPQIDTQAFKTFPELATYLQSQFGSSADAPPAGSDVDVTTAGATAQA